MDNQKEDIQDKPLTHEEFSRRGGQKTLETRGREFLGEIAQKGGEATKAKFGPDHYKRIQKLAAESRRKNKEERERQEESADAPSEEFTDQSSDESLTLKKGFFSKLFKS